MTAHAIPNGWLYFWSIVGIGMIPITAWFIYMLRLMSRDLRKTREQFHMIDCVNCGKTYHRDWGSMCPDCSGAD